ELLELLLELLIGAAPRLTRGGVLKGLDRQVDLAVILDRCDLDLDAVPLAQVLADVLDVVPVDLGDVDETHPSVLELQERSVVLDACHGSRDGRTDLDLCDVAVSFRRSGPLPDARQVCGTGTSGVNRVDRGAGGLVASRDGGPSPRRSPRVARPRRTAPARGRG